MTQTEYQILEILKRYLPADTIREIVRDLRREVYGDRATRALIERLSQITMT